MKDRMVDNIVNQMGLSSSSERIVIFSKTYEGHYKISLNMFKEKPLLGICLGMQLLTEGSEEGHLPGLSIVRDRKSVV